MMNGVDVDFEKPERRPSKVKARQGSITATAPGKVILFGEHAVVYGQPAIAVPVEQVQATVTLEPVPPGQGLTLVAADLDRVMPLAEAHEEDPLAVMARLTLEHLEAPAPDAVLTIHSTIPIASGLGSGTAVSTAIVRGLAAFLGRELPPATISRLVYEVEKLHHGTPSGIDNTVVAYGRPVFFVRQKRLEIFGVGAPLQLVIGDTGIASPTRVAVGDVRRGWEQDVDRYECLFSEVGEIVQEARGLIERGDDVARLGVLMERNHELLREMGVSGPELERLVAAARAAGAMGAKLSGAGRGGNMIALTMADDSVRIAGALRQAGAVRVIDTVIPAWTEVEEVKNGS
jgi:mevalonate kinase